MKGKQSDLFAEISSSSRRRLQSFAECAAAIDGLFQDAVKHEGNTAFTSYIEFARRMSNLSVYNAMLVRIQRPGAAAVEGAAGAGAAAGAGLAAFLAAGFFAAGFLAAGFFAAGFLAAAFFAAGFAPSVFFDFDTDIRFLFSVHPYLIERNERLKYRF